MGDLSVQEANKIRLAMGMKPLPVPGAPSSGLAFKDASKTDASQEELDATLEGRTAQSFDNWNKLQDEATTKAKREAQKAAIQKAREHADRHAKLEGKGLAEQADDMDDRTWLMQANKRKKKLAKAEKTQREFEEREKEALAARQYTEADLAGIKVGHEVDEFGNGEAQVLVLKDTAVDKDEDDELEAIALKEKEKLDERLDLKKRKRAYDPVELEESGQASILTQYDEEIDGKKKKAFTLNGQGSTVENAQVDAHGPKRKKVAISLDILKDDAPANDYKDISEVKLRKPKRKTKSANKRTFNFGEVAVPDGTMDEDEKPMPRTIKSFVEESFVLNDDLGTRLAAQRRAALKRRNKVDISSFARQLREQTPGQLHAGTTDPADEPGLVIDETTEFVSTLEKPKAPEEDVRKRAQSAAPRSAAGSPGDSLDATGDVDMSEAAAKDQIGDGEETAGNPLDNEATLDKGLGAALALVKQRGLLADLGPGDPSDRLFHDYRKHQHFIAAKAKAQEEAERFIKDARERDRQSSNYDRMTAREKQEFSHKQNQLREQFLAEKLDKLYDDAYKPNVQLNYVDSHGRQMTPKEAFKHLSHQFHGKGSGNQKTQKHLDKVQGEKQRMAQSSLDASQHVGISNTQGIQAKKHKQAGVRLQ